VSSETVHSPAPQRRPSSQGDRSTEEILLGREQEMSELLAGLQDALSGSGRLFLIGGEPGIGKSSLADELAARARARGATVLWGRCWEAGGAPAYWPWVQCLRSYLRRHDPAVVREHLGGGAADIAQMLPEIEALVPDLVPPPSADPSACSIPRRVF
jgi:predicted ATPase